jgi:rod shape-determining protein MreD
MSPQDAMGGFNIKKGMGAHVMALLILAATLLQTTLLGKVSLWDLKPELPLILACYFLLSLPEGKALTGAFALGLIIDTYSLAPFGLTAISFLLLAAALLRAGPRVTSPNILTWCGVVAGATLFNGFSHLSALRLTLGEPLPTLQSLSRLLLLTVINTLVGVCLFPLFSRMSRGLRGSSSAVREAGKIDSAPWKAL